MDYLEQLILITEFIGSYPDIEILEESDTHMIIEYGWSDYEESDNTNITIDLEDMSITSIESGHSVMEGDYDSTEELPFESWDLLFEHLKEYILTILNDICSKNSRRSNAYC